MAEAVPFIAKAVAGFAVAKLVGKVTGNDMIGAVAGGLIGIGIGFDPATGFSWEGFGEAAASSGAETVAGGAQGLLSEGSSFLNPDTSTFLNYANDTSGITDLMSSGADFAASAPGASSAALVTDKATKSADLVKDMPKATDISKAAPTAAAKEPGLLSKAGSWIEDHPLISQMAFKGVESMLAPDSQDIWDMRSDYEKQKYEREHRPVNPADFTGDLEKVNQRLAEGGYKPQYAQVTGAGYQPMYAAMQSPNYRSMIERIRNQRS